MFDLNQDAAATRRFLAFTALTPLLLQLIHKAESDGGTGAEKRESVIAAAGEGLLTLEQAGYLPTGTNTSEATKKEIGKLNDALVASFNASGVFERKRKKAAEAAADTKGHTKK